MADPSSTRNLPSPSPPPGDGDATSEARSPRADRIEEIRALLATNSYRIDSEQIANKILDRIAATPVRKTSGTL